MHRIVKPPSAPQNPWNLIEILNPGVLTVPMFFGTERAGCPEQDSRVNPAGT
jgi:hypothetical protein